MKYFQIIIFTLLSLYFALKGFARFEVHDNDSGFLNIIAGIMFAIIALTTTIKLIKEIKNKQVNISLLSVVLILVPLATIISRIIVIPSWVNIQTTLLISVYSLALILALIFLYNLWLRNNTKRKINLKQQLLRTGIIVIIFPLALLITIPSFSKPELVNHVRHLNHQIYVYHNRCFPPDSECECNYYGSLVYQKNRNLPIMHLILETNFYIGDIDIMYGNLTVEASDICSNDIRKSKQIHLKK